MGLFEGEMYPFCIPPRSVKLLCIHEMKQHPFLLSTNIHFTQGACELKRLEWDEKELRLTIELKDYINRKARIFICLPEGYHLGSVLPGGINSNVRGSILTVEMHPELLTKKEINIWFNFC